MEPSECREKCGSAIVVVVGGRGGEGGGIGKLILFKGLIFGGLEMIVNFICTL